MRSSKQGTYCVVWGLALALFFGSSCGHPLDVSIWNVDEDAGTLLTAVGTVGTINMVTQLFNVRVTRCCGANTP